MSNYTKTTDFEAKDSLPSGDSGKIIRGSEFETEFDNIATAIASKSDANNPTFTGTVTIDGLTVNGNTVLGNAATDTVTVTADIASNLLPSADDTYNLGAVGAEWNDLHVDGVAYIDTIAGFATTENITFGDNDKAIFGASSDLQIYHTGSPSSNSIIEDAGAGNLTLKSNGAGIHFRDGSDNLVFNVDLDSATTLYHNTSAKLTTTSTGVDVTGTVVADGLTVDGDITFDTEGDKLLFETSNALLTPSIYADDDGLGNSLKITADNGVLVRIDERDSNTGSFRVQNGSTHKDAILVNNNGDISFYEDTGTTAKLFWDASAEQLKLGTIEGAAGGSIVAKTDSNGYALAIEENSGTERWSVGVDVDGDLGFFNSTDTTASVTFDDSGNVGIGTDSPNQNLDVDGNVHLASGGGSLLVGASGAAIIDLERPTANYIRANNSGTANLVVGAGDNIRFCTGQADGDFAQNEAMRIDSAGNVGIGTSSPSADLHINNASGSELRLDTEGGSNANSLVNFRENGTDRASLYWDGGANGLNLETTFGDIALMPTGNVGIGTSSPDTALHVESAASTYLQLERTVSGSEGKMLLGAATNFNQIISRDSGTGAKGIQVLVGNDEAMRIDSSGNLLLGKTVADNTTQGIRMLGSAGFASFVRDGAEPIVVNRLTSSGDLIDFRKDGTTVGSIGVAFNDNLFISGNSSHAGIAFGTNEIYPSDPAGSGLDNDLTLGSSTARFKDLYLSGGAYLGGSAAANKLDDYEEGTFTVAVEGSTTAGTGTYATRNGQYTKIGNVVHVRMYINMSAHTGAGNLLITGLPFNAKNQANGFYSASIDFSNGITKTAGRYIFGVLRPNTSQIEVQEQNTGSVVTAWNNNVALDAAFQAAITVTYTTD